jgi:aminoglycoside 3-N-acetyltransferase
VGERRAGAHYLDIPFDPTWPRARMSWFPGCSRAFAVVEAELRRRGDVRDGRVGGALAQVMPAAAVVAATVEVVRADPAALLCTDPACYRCSTARGR